MNRAILPGIVMGIAIPIPPTALRSRPSQAAARNPSGLQGLSTTDRSEMATEDAYNRQSTNWKGK